MAKHILLIDGNSIAHANHNATTLTVGDFQVQAIFGFLKFLRALLHKTPGDVEPIVLWDGRAQFRVDIYDGYKGNRDALDAKQAAHKEAFKRQTPFIEKALEFLGVKQIRSPLLEADDLAFYFTGLLDERQITLVTGDQDWLQLVNPNVSWFDPIRDRKVDHMTFLESVGYMDVYGFTEGKALQGDSSDNVPGIAGIGEKTAQLFIAKWGRVERFFQEVDAGTYTPKARASKTAKSLHHEQILASPEGRELFVRNMRLLNLRAARRPEPGELVINAKQPDPEKFIALCERLNFASILRERHDYFRTLNITPPTA